MKTKAIARRDWPLLLRGAPAATVRRRAQRPRRAPAGGRRPLGRRRPYERAIAAHPGHAYNNLATSCRLQPLAEALGLHRGAPIAPSRRRVPADAPQPAGARRRGAVRRGRRPHGAGLRYEPSRDDTLGRMVHLMQRTCDWRGVGTAARAPCIARRGRADDAEQRPPLSPMHALTMPPATRPPRALPRPRGGDRRGIRRRPARRRRRRRRVVAAATAPHVGFLSPTSSTR